MNQKSNQLAIVKKDVIDVVSRKVREFQNSQDLKLPSNYSPENALKSAFLILQRTLDKNKQPVLKVCTQDSIANALLDMIVQGLNPAKNQCYFIAHGNQLVCRRSYFGTMAVTKTFCNAVDFFAQVIWKDDQFEYEIKNGQTVITKHAQRFENIGKEPQGAYCTIEFDNGKIFTDIMTMDQIRKSWIKSQMNPNAENSTHSQFSEQMIKRTVINRACKKYINASSDSGILVDRFARTDEIADETDFETEVNENANLMPIDTEEMAADPTDNLNELTEEEKQAIIEQEMAEDECKIQSGPGF